MICVTGNETNAEALAQRLTRPEAQELLHEVRLDAIDGALDPVFALIERHARRLVVCCRPTREGGAFSGDEGERIAILERAARCGVAYLDVEHDVSDDDLRRLRAVIAGKLVLSLHDFDGVPTDLRQRLAAMSMRGADVLKAAVTVHDAAELEPLLDLVGAFDQKPTVLIGMGPAGLLSRCRYGAFGAPWTYVKLDDESGTAPGQLTLKQARTMGLPETAAAPLFALVGGPQVFHSSGPAVYNQLFRQMNEPWSYLPISTQQGERTITMMRRIGLVGASVTMPHKAVALKLAGENVDEIARLAGSANSLRYTDQGPEAINTDVAGVADPLQRVFAQLPQPPRRAIVLGAGGAARAAAVACKAVLKLDVSVAAVEVVRRDGALEVPDALAALDVPCVPWDERYDLSAEVLINATPLSGANKTPWDAEAFDFGVVFDLAITGESSALLERARTNGAFALEPIEMWLAQGAKQMSWMTNKTITVEQMRDLLPHRQ